MKTAWRVVFLALPALWTVMECWAAWDRDPRTEPLTDLIVGYVPWEVPLAVFGALAVWLVPHFWVRYRRRGGSPVDGGSGGNPAPVTAHDRRRSMKEV